MHSLRSSKLPTIAGFAICLASVVLGQVGISRLLGSGAGGSGAPEDIGYTFTGLTAALGFAVWKWGRAGTEHKGAKLWARKLFWALVASIAALFGWTYACVGGASVERHARTFASMPLMLYCLTIAKRGRSMGDGSRAAE